MRKEELTILLADDEKATRFLYEEELLEEGYQILTAENGLQVLGTLEDKKVDLLLTDIKMPDMDALELIPRVRIEHPLLPIVVVSAFKGMERELTSKGHNLSAVFSKPVDMHLLRRKINEILQV